MSRTFIVAGTDTGVGKTIFSAALAGSLGAFYWKPVQAGLEESTDTDVVAGLSGLPAERILPEAYRLTTPCSPHRAAELDGTAIDPARLGLPDVDGPLIVEGAGGAAVPLRPDYLYLDLFAAWRAPVIVVARTGLGTINHSLLTLEALRSRGIAVHGVAFVGAPHQDSEAIIGRISGAKRLGRLPILPHLDGATLRAAFRAEFALEDFQ